MPKRCPPVLTCVDSSSHCCGVPLPSPPVLTTSTWEQLRRHQHPLQPPPLVASPCISKPLATRIIAEMKIVIIPRFRPDFPTVRSYPSGVSTRIRYHHRRRTSMYSAECDVVSGTCTPSQPHPWTDCELGWCNNRLVCNYPSQPSTSFRTPM